MLIVARQAALGHSRLEVRLPERWRRPTRIGAAARHPEVPA